eukprot:2083750-Pyramimonas_sp.AAC.1
MSLPPLGCTVRPRADDGGSARNTPETHYYLLTPARPTTTFQHPRDPHPFFLSQCLTPQCRLSLRPEPPPLRASLR